MEVIALAIVLALYLPTSIYFIFKAYREGIKTGLSISRPDIELPKVSHAEVKHERKIEIIEAEKEVIEAENEGQRLVRLAEEAELQAEHDKRIQNDVTEALNMDLIYGIGEDDGKKQ